MNTISKYLITWLCLCSSALFAQITSHMYYEDGTEVSPRQQARLDRTALERQNFQDNGRAGTIRIPIRHIVLRRDDGLGGQTDSGLQNLMDSLNHAFASTNIQFYECSRTYVDNSFLLSNYNKAYENQLDPYAASNVLNLFHCHTITKDTAVHSSFSLCGYVNDIGTGDRIFIDNFCTTYFNQHIHYFGHYFSLYDTDHGGDELVNGSNCKTAGDRICDTGADPGVSWRDINSSCNYIGTDVDVNGHRYNPPTRNYMANSPKECGPSFTAGQIARMRYNAVNERAYLTCSCFAYDYVGYFNFGTTTSGNNYTTSFNTSITSVYNCGGDANQLRVGSCNSFPNWGGDFVSVEFDVPAGTDKLKLRLKGGWQNGSSEIYIDDVYQKDFTLATNNCYSNHIDVYLYDISSFSQDGKVVIKLVDPDPGCSGDFNIDYMEVHASDCIQSAYAKVPYTTTFSSGVLDNYWLTQSSNEFGNSRLTIFHGPYIGGFHLLMDSRQTWFTGNYALNQADLRVNLSNCSDADLHFRWKDINDESHNQDGVYLSTDGGENFVKIYSLTNGFFTFWNSVSLDLDALATANGLMLSDECIIRFQQYDDKSSGHDGIAIDYVRVLGCDNTPAPMLALSTQDIEKGQVPSLYSNYDLYQDDVQLNTSNAINSTIGVAVFPNPAKDVLNLQLSDFEMDEQLNIKVINMLGQVQFLQQYTVTNNTKDLVQLQVQQLPAGIYTVVIENQQRIIAHQKVTLQ